MTHRKRIDHLPGDRRLTGVNKALLSSDFDDVLQSIVVDAASQVGTPIALVTLVLQNIQLFRAHHGLPDDLADVRATARDASFCQLVVRDDDLLEVSDAAEREDIPQELVERYGIRAYLGAPIHLAGQPLGSLCVIDTKPRNFTVEDRALLRMLAQEVDARIHQWSTAATSNSVGTVRAAVGPVFAEMRNHLSPLAFIGSELRMTTTELDVQLRGLSFGMHAVLPDAESVERLLQRYERAADWSERAVAGLISCVDLLEGLADLRSTATDAADLVQRVDGLCRHLSETAGGLHWSDPPPGLRVELPLAIAVVVTASLLNRLLLRIRSRTTEGLQCRLLATDEVLLECQSPALDTDDVSALVNEASALAGQMTMTQRIGVSGTAGCLRIHLPRAVSTPEAG